jgi:restriction endonuclease S subunit
MAALGDLVEQRKDRVGRANEAKVLSSTKYRGLVPSEEYFKGRTIHSHDLSNYKLVKRSWFAYATNHLAEGSIGLQDGYEVGCVSPIYTVFRCREGVDPYFLYRVLRSPSLFAQYELREQASVNRRGAIRFSDFATISVASPESWREQRRIAEILDAVDVQIDAEQRCLDKLARLPTSVVRAKVGSEQSGSSRFVDRLGDALISIQAGRSPDLQDVPAADGEWGVLKVSAVQPGGLDASENKAAHDPSLINSAIEVRDGDLIITRANTDDLIGMACIAHSPRPHLMLCDKTLRLVVNPEKAIPEFIRLVLGLEEVRSQIRARASGTSGSMKNISQASIRQLLIPLPSLDEQQRLIDAATACGTKIADTRGRVAKLRLVKQGLMDDLLSGKVRVEQFSG